MEGLEGARQRMRSSLDGDELRKVDAVDCGAFCFKRARVRTRGARRTGVGRQTRLCMYLMLCPYSASYVDMKSC